MLTIVTWAVAAVVVALSLRKYAVMSKKGCGSGCGNCPSRQSCSKVKKIDEK